MTGIMNTPVGKLYIYAYDGCITGIFFKEPDIFKDISCLENASGSCERIMEQCKKQLEEYFSGERKVFDIQIKLNGTNFRREVWHALTSIPYGQTRSYGELAKQIGRPQAVRAVGGANHNNPISIIVPCHRVIGADGSLTGYGGGLDAKEWLLRHERLNMQSNNMCL